MTNEVLFFALVAEVVLRHPLPPEAAAALTPETVAALYPLAERHDMAHLVAEALSARGLLPEGDDNPYRKALLLAHIRYAAQDYESTRIEKALTAEGFPHLFLKGSILRGLYPAPHLRTACDIDVLVRESDIKTAARRLAIHLGYKIRGEVGYHDISLYSIGGVHLELHHNLMEKMPRADRVLLRVWENAAPRTEGALDYRMTPDFFYFHHIAHMAYHFLHGGCGVRAFLDLRLLAEHAPPSEGVHHLLDEAGLSPFAAAAEALARAWFDREPLSPLAEQMQAVILAGGTYGSKQEGVALQSAAAGGKCRYLLSRLFVPRAVLAARYPAVARHPILVPYYTVCRWCRLLPTRRARRELALLAAAKRKEREEMLLELSLIER